MYRFLVAGIVSICLSLGCGVSNGKPLGVVTGAITINDEPASGLRVIFVPERKGSPSYGVTDDDGVYRLQFSQHSVGAELGKHHVLVENIEPETDENGDPVLSMPVIKIPQKYQQPGALSAEVASGRNQCDFSLEVDTKQANSQADSKSQHRSVGSRTASK